MPWPDHWLIGTTDAPYDGPLRPAGRRRLGDRRAAARPSTTRSTSTCGGPTSWARTRACGRSSRRADGSTVKASREHRVTVEQNGIVRIGGGKYTTYRVMARDVIDAVLGREGAERLPSATAERRLVGAADRPVLDRIAAEIASVPAVAAAHPEAGRPPRGPPRDGGAGRRGRSAASSTCCDRSCRVGRSWRRRSRGPCGASSRCRVDDVLSRRLRLSPELADRGRRGRAAGRRDHGAASSAGTRRAGTSRSRPTSRPRPRVRDRAVAVGARSRRRSPRSPPRRSPADAVTRRSRAASTIAPCHRSATSPTTSPARCTSSGSRSRSCRSRWPSWPSCVAYRLGWIAAARRHPGRTAGRGRRGARGRRCPWAGTWARRSSSAPRSSKPDRPSRGDASRRPSPPSRRSHRRRRSCPRARRRRLRPPPPTPFAATTVASGEFSGTDDFHFGHGTASIVEVEPGRYHLRLDEFSVRNGPDLFVYLSPDADGYADDALELGKLKATDGSFGYDLPDGIDPARFRERPHLVQAVQPPVRRRRRSAPEPDTPKVGAIQARSERVPSRLKTPRKRPWPERSSTQALTRTPLTADARNPTGSRRLPRGVSSSCTTTRT